MLGMIKRNFIDRSKDITLNIVAKYGFLTTTYHAYDRRVFIPIRQVARPSVCSCIVMMRRRNENTALQE